MFSDDSIQRILASVKEQNSIEQHLLDRHVDLELHQPVIDEENRVATFFLYNGVGDMTGFQQYRPDCDKKKHNDPRMGRYFTYRVKPYLAFFGFESYHFRPDVLYVTEGIFDAVRLHKYEQPAIALLSNDPNRDVRNFLNCLPRKIIAVCDSGKAGRKLAKIGNEVITLDEGDLGDASEQFVKSII